MTREPHAPEPDPVASPSAPTPTQPTPAQPTVAPPHATFAVPPASPSSAQPQAPAFVPYTPPQQPAFTTAPVGWTIAAMLTFWPTGIPALLASHRAARAFGAGDHATAQRESATARRWGVVSVCVAAGLVVLNTLLLIAWFAFVALAVHSVREDGWRDGPGWSNGQELDGRQFDGEEPSG